MVFFIEHVADWQEDIFGTLSFFHLLIYAAMLALADRHIIFREYQPC